MTELYCSHASNPTSIVSYTHTDLSLPILVPNSVAISGGPETDVAVPVATDATTLASTDLEGYTAMVTNSEGAVIDSPAVTWAVKLGSNTAPTGLSIADGVVTVTSAASAGTYTVTATATQAANAGLTQNATASTSFTLTKNAPAAKYVTVSGGSNSIIVPADGAVDATAAFTAGVKDQYGAMISNSSLTWTVEDGSGPVAGVSIENGIVKVAHAAKDAITDTNGKEFTVTAACGRASGTASVTVKRAASTATAVKIYKGDNAITSDSLVIPVSGDANIATYTAKLFDQYGAEMADRNFNWSTSDTPNGTTVSNNVVSVAVTPNAGAGNIGSFTLTATDSAATTMAGYITVNVTKLNASWSAIGTITSPTYGDTNAKIITGENASTMAYNTDGSSNYSSTLNGSYSVTEADTIQTAGLGKGITVTFTADQSESNGAYKGISLSKTFTVTINKAERELSAMSAATLYLAGTALTGQVAKPSYVDLDNSAVVKYTSGNTDVATVNNAGLVRAVGNSGGSAATITAVIPETTNYLAASAVTVATVYTITEPVAGISSTIVDGDKLSIRLDGNTIKVSGTMSKDSTLAIVPTLAYGATLQGESPVTVTATAAAALAAGASFTVDLFAGQSVTYTIDTSGVVILPANVTLAEGNADVDKVDGIPALTGAESEGLLGAAVGTISARAEALSQANGNAKVNAEAYLKITPKRYVDIPLSFTIEVTPMVQYYDNSNQAAPEPLGNAEPIPNSAIQAPVKIVINRPACFDGVMVSNIIAKHGDEIIQVHAGDGNTIYWYQSSFSTVELYVDARGGRIMYNFEDGAVQTLTYNAADLNKPLPTDNKAGCSFTGWTIGGVDGTFTTLTDALLDAINGKILTATPNFAPMGGGVGGVGGMAASDFEIKVEAGPGGSVQPSDSVQVKKGEDVTFTITPDAGYRIADVLVDGVSVGAVERYTFEKVEAAHTIRANFALINLFTDVNEQNWFYDEVMAAYALGLMDGVGNGLFDPYSTTTRAMVVTALWRLAGEPAAGGAAFTDVPDGKWYSQAVCWAAGNGIVNGVGDNKFAPDDLITREQLATMLYRYAVYASYDASARAGLDAFTDAEQVSAWAREAVEWAVASGLMVGKTGSVLDPGGDASRAEVAAILQRFVGLHGE